MLGDSNFHILVREIFIFGNFDQAVHSTLQKGTTSISLQNIPDYVISYSSKFVSEDDKGLTS